jgi:metal-responsive CopG/Arc/MetJ family transcriptional regulator
MPRSKGSSDYVTVQIPKELVDMIDTILAEKKGGYRSRTEFVADAVRRRIEDLLKS